MSRETSRPWGRRGRCGGPVSCRRPPSSSRTPPLAVVGDRRRSGQGNESWPSRGGETRGWEIACEAGQKWQRWILKWLIINYFYFCFSVFILTAILTRARFWSSFITELEFRFALSSKRYYIIHLLDLKFDFLNILILYDVKLHYFIYFNIF